MKKFTFTLDKVLSYKRQYEDSLRNEHAVALRKVADQEEAIRRLDEDDARTRRQLQSEKINGCKVLQIHTYERYLEHLASERFRAVQTLQILRRHEEEKRAALIAAKTETTSIDKLKEKKRFEYNKMEQKEQEQLVEEFVNHGMIASR